MNQDVTKTFDPLGPDAQYREYLSRDRFKLQQCQSCQKFLFYPRMLCDACGCADLQWQNVSGKATVYSTSIVRDSVKGDYNIALIQLEEGPRMLSRVTDIAPEAVTIGMPVEAYVGEIEGCRLVLFR